MKPDPDPIREARDARERMLQSWRERIDRLNGQLAKTRAIFTDPGPASPADRARARQAHDALRALKERSLREMREQVERASEAVRIAELARLKEDVAGALRTLEAGVAQFDQERKATAGERLAGLRACTDAVNRVLGRAHSLVLRAEDDARGSQAAIRRCERRIEEASARRATSEAAAAVEERTDLERFLAHEQAHAGEARTLYQMLSERKERVLALLRKRAPGEVPG